MSIESVMPSDRLILCHPLLLLPSIFPSIWVFSNDSVPRIRWPKQQSIGVSASAPILPMNILDWFPLRWTGWISLKSKGLLSLLQHHSSKASIFPHSAFKWLGHYIYWYDLVHLAIWFLFVLSVLCFPFSLILPYLKLSGYLCITGIISSLNV